MPNKFMCTVLLISYNHEKTIAKAIESVMEQKTQFPFQILAFDDGSTDGTKEILLDYAEKYKDIFFPHIAEKNQGPQANYWNAFSAVDTKYCVLLEGDDFYCHPDKVELQIQALENHPECSFCGHDTYLYSLGESFREYKEGSTSMIEPILKTKSIFTYRDFQPITTGGFIPYGSARMIRTSALRMNEIRYKEAVLFDFTQFYFLLLQGDYYYIDMPMSVYVRTGDGICSGKSPMVFLNDFLQAAIDFNKQTDNVIADKIYSDCQLQIGFRLEKYRNSQHPVQDSARRRNFMKATVHADVIPSDPCLLVCQKNLSPDCYSFLCNGGAGHTMVLCAIREQMEAVVSGKIIFLVREEQAFILGLYGISDYVIVDIDCVNIEFLGMQTPYPERGKIYVTHPFGHPEAANYYRPIHLYYSSVRYLPWLLTFLGVEKNTEIAPPKFQSSSLDRKLEEKLSGLGSIDQMVLFFPEANTVPCICGRIWEKQARVLAEQGLTVISCVKEPRRTISGTRYVEMTLEEAVKLGQVCHSIYCMRNGIAELLASRGKCLHVFYPSHAAFYIYSVNAMYGREDIQEKIYLEVETVAPMAIAAPSRPYLFGRIRIPECGYQFYLRHKPLLRRLRRFVHWQ